VTRTRALGLFRVRLVEEIRQEDSLCYDIFARLYESANTFLQVTASTEPDDTLHMVTLMQKVARGLSTALPPTEEFLRGLSSNGAKRC